MSGESVFSQGVDGEQSAPTRDAATVVLLREGAGGGSPEVLMVRRPRGAAFMADAFVFPGGRLDDADIASHPTAGEESLAASAAQVAADPARAVALYVAALRELFEEAGILLAVDQRGALVTDSGDGWLAEARAAVHEGTRGFREVLAERDLRLDLTQLVFFARWITPRTEPRRFDARFFLARMPAGQTAAHDPAELVEQRWATPRALLDQQRSEGLKLPPPTLWHLGDLAAQGSIDAVFAWSRGREVAAVRPKLVPAGETLAIVLPWDPEYAALPGDSEIIAASHPVAGAVTRYVLEDGRWVARGSSGG